MIRMEDENTVHRASQNRIDLVIFTWNAKAHVQEIRCEI